MNKSVFVFTLFFASTVAFAQDAYRCKVNGAMVIQDRPCPGSARYSNDFPAPPTQTAQTNSGSAGKTPDSSSAAPRQMTDLERQKQYLATGAKERRISDLKYEISGIEQSIANLQSNMHEELAALERKKAYANNNLAGATYLNSLANERQAVTARYEVDISAQKDRLKSLRDDLVRAQKD